MVSASLLACACNAPSPGAWEQSQRIAAVGIAAARGISPEAAVDPRGHAMRAAGRLQPDAWIVAASGPDGDFDASPEAIVAAAVSARAGLFAEFGPDVRLDLRRWSRMKCGVEAPFLALVYDPTNGTASGGDELWGEIDHSALFLRWPADSRARLEQHLARQVSPETGT